MASKLYIQLYLHDIHYFSNTICFILIMETNESAIKLLSVIKIVF